MTTADELDRTFLDRLAAHLAPGPWTEHEPAKIVEWMKRGESWRWVRPEREPEEEDAA